MLKTTLQPRTDDQLKEIGDVLLEGVSGEIAKDERIAGRRAGRKQLASELDQLNLQDWVKEFAKSLHYDSDHPSFELHEPVITGEHERRKREAPLRLMDKIGDAETGKWRQQVTEGRVLKFDERGIYLAKLEMVYASESSQRRVATPEWTEVGRLELKPRHLDALFIEGVQTATIRHGLATQMDVYARKRGAKA